MKKCFTILIAVTVLLPASQLYAKTEFTELVRSDNEYSSAGLESATVDGKAGIAVIFKGSDDLHYYATAESAPAPGLELKVTPTAEGVTFGDPVWPEYSYFDDPSEGKIEVFVGEFRVFVPIEKVADGLSTENLTVKIAGITCTNNLCLPPFDINLAAKLDVSKWPQVLIEAAGETHEIPDAAVVDNGTDLTKTLSNWKTIDLAKGQALNTLDQGPRVEKSESVDERGVAWYFLLALLAGLSINIMPCVLPVIPLIIMRLVAQAKESGPRRVALGFSFCGGIVLFFTVFAAISVAVKLLTGASLDLNSLYRNATAVTVLFLAIVFFALVLMDLLTLTLPSSVANKQTGGSGFSASIGMGFFAGLLSTPCSGAILGVVLVWAQTQTLFVSSILLVLLGVGMAAPYAILVSIPSLLNFVPKPGTWMENFKKAGGFLLLLIAVKFTLTALPKDHLINVLMYGVIFSFAVWMWGTWVTFSTPKGRKWMIRLVALVIAVAAGKLLLPAPEVITGWQKYDAAVIQKAIVEKQPVLLKFTADWCTNCKVLDKQVFQLKEIETFLENKGILTIKADTTQSHYPATKDMNAVFGEAGSVPLTVILNPANQSITKLRGIFTPKEFKEAIEKQF